MCITISALSMYYFFERHGDILRNIAYKQITNHMYMYFNKNN